MNEKDDWATVEAQTGGRPEFLKRRDAAKIRTVGKIASFGKTYGVSAGRLTSMIGGVRIPTVNARFRVPCSAYGDDGRLCQEDSVYFWTFKRDVQSWCRKHVFKVKRPSEHYSWTDESDVVSTLLVGEVLES